MLISSAFACTTLFYFFTSLFFYSLGYLFSLNINPFYIFYRKSIDYLVHLQLPLTLKRITNWFYEMVKIYKRQNSVKKWNNSKSHMIDPLYFWMEQDFILVSVHRENYSPSICIFGFFKKVPSNDARCYRSWDCSGLFTLNFFYWFKSQNFYFSPSSEHLYSLFILFKSENLRY
jgi:hypothetical protein